MKICSVDKRTACKILLSIAVLNTLLVWPNREAITESQVTQACPTGSVPAQVAFTFVSESGEFPSNIKKEDLSLRVNGSLVEISAVAPQVAEPLDLAILIDVSVSQEESLPTTKFAAKEAISALLDPAKDRVALVSFAHDIDVEQPLTSDMSKALAALDAVKVTLPPGYVGGGVVISRAPKVISTYPGSTSLWDTSARVLEKVYGTPPEDKRKRAIILLTDGEDTSSQAKLSATVSSAIKNDVSIYSIGVAGRYATLNRDSLKKLSDQTGGTAVFPKTADDLRTGIADIGKRVKSEYAISFCRVATASGAPLKVRLEIANPKFRRSRIAYRRQ